MAFLPIIGQSSPTSGVLCNTDEIDASIHGLPSKVNKAQLMNLFDPYGGVKDISIIHTAGDDIYNENIHGISAARDKYPNHRDAYAVVEFDSFYKREFFYRKTAATVFRRKEIERDTHARAQRANRFPILLQGLDNKCRMIDIVCTMKRLNLYMVKGHLNRTYNYCYDTHAEVTFPSINAYYLAKSALSNSIFKLDAKAKEQSSSDSPQPILIDVTPDEITHYQGFDYVQQVNGTIVMCNDREMYTRLVCKQ